MKLLFALLFSGMTAGAVYLTWYSDAMLATTYSEPGAREGSLGHHRIGSGGYRVGK